MTVALAIQVVRLSVVRSGAWRIRRSCLPSETIRLSLHSFTRNEQAIQGDRDLPTVHACVRKLDGKFKTFDVRNVQLMRLAPDFADAARMGYATKKRKKSVGGRKAFSSQQAIAANEPESDSFELRKRVAIVCPLPFDAEPVTVNALPEADRCLGVDRRCLSGGRTL